MSRKVGLPEIRAAAAVIAALEPKPGRRYSSEVANYVLPEEDIQKSLETIKDHPKAPENKTGKW